MKERTKEGRKEREKEREKERDWKHLDGGGRPGDGNNG